MCWIVQNLTGKYEWIRHHYLNDNNFSSCYHYMSSTSSHQHYPSWCPYISNHVFNQFRHLNYIWIYQFSIQIMYITFEMLKPFGLHASKVFFSFFFYLAFQSFNFERTWWRLFQKGSCALNLISTFLLRIIF